MNPLWWRRHPRLVLMLCSLWTRWAGPRLHNSPWKGSQCSQNALHKLLVSTATSNARLCRTTIAEKCREGDASSKVRHSEQPIPVADDNILGPTHNLLASHLYPWLILVDVHVHSHVLQIYPWITSENNTKMQVNSAMSCKTDAKTTQET